MRIIQVDVNYDDSSTGKLVKDLQTGLEKLNHKVKCCYGRHTKQTPSTAIKIAHDIEVNIHAGLTRITGFTGGFSPMATKRLISEIEEFKPDVIHLHELHGYYIDIYKIINYIKLSQIPVVWTFHCEFMYTGKCGHAHECNRWEDKCGKCPQVGEYPRSLFFDQTASMLTRKKSIFNNFEMLKIITPSEWLAERVRRSFLFEKNVSVIHNGIDTEIFRPRNSNSLRNDHKITTKHVLLSVAPNLLSEAKGGSWVLELAKRMKDSDVTFLMIGVDEPSQIKEENVIALPKINDKELLSEYYSLADFTILTSKRETFSLVCAESLACGTPIIGFDAGAPSEVAPPGYGNFIKYGEMDFLFTAVTSALSNRLIYKSKEDCVQFARSNYSKEKMVNNYIGEYQLLLGSK